MEVLVKFNTPDVGQLRSCHYGAQEANGDILVFLDADCIVSRNFFKEISEKAKNPYFVGGGVKWVRLDRYSFGICAAMFLLACVLLIWGITVGAFWVRKSAWNEIGGFKGKHKYWDLDFARELKRYAKTNGKKFESLKEAHIVWSTRKFDWFGDWHWLLGYKAG